MKPEKTFNIPFFFRKASLPHIFPHPPQQHVHFQANNCFTNTSTSAYFFSANQPSSTPQDQQEQALSLVPETNSQHHNSDGTPAAPPSSPPEPTNPEPSQVEATSASEATEGQGQTSGMLDFRMAF